MHNEYDNDDGNQIEFRCQSCEEITLHTIITDEDDDSETSVQCSICEETQYYRPGKSLKKKTTSGKKSASDSRREQAEKSVLADYKKLLAKHDVSAAVEYTMTASFKAADMINHQYFGIGFVRGIISPNKIEVLFSEGCKILICAPHNYRNLILETANLPSKKGQNHKSRNPSSWKPWSSAPDEKEEHQLGWGDESSSEQFDLDA